MMPAAVIIGGGPAGLSAAIYAARAGLEVTVLYRDGGALEKTDMVENYFGFPEPVPGPELLLRGREQAKRLGAKLVQCEVTGIEYSEKGFKVKSTEGEFLTRALVIAAGASRNAPDIPGVKDHEGSGVSYCAVCDAFFYREKPVAVLGNGEYALEEARTLLQTSSAVTLLTDGMDVPMELPDKLCVDERKIAAVEGNGKLERVRFDSGDALEIDGLFVALGTAGSSELALKLGAFTENGKIKTNANMASNIPGVFAAGDCTGGLLQIAKAVSDGAQAALSMIKYLRKN